MFTIRLRDGDAWLTLLDEKGETRTFERRSEAIIVGQELLLKGKAQEVEIRWDGQTIRIWFGGDGGLRLEGSL